MAKTLFDPAKAAGAEPAACAEAADARPLTVSQASEVIRQALEHHTPATVRVIGQISNLSAREHWYFSLKDDNAVLNCVAWATAIRRMSFSPRDGEMVVASGHFSHYGPQGRTQLYVKSIEPAGGAGALELRFRALCEELRKLGYFDESRKKPLPVLPRRIAVITSAGGAALHDVITTAAQRCKAVGILVVDVKVQGAAAAADIARAIRWVDARQERLGVEAILVTRGGGSIEDLWAFNEREVADAVRQCRLPVVAAIGHESDTTIIELVADVRASTPTQAAMRLVPAASELSRQLRHTWHRIDVVMHRQHERREEQLKHATSALRQSLLTNTAEARIALERAASRLARARPDVMMAQRHERLRGVVRRLHQAMHRRLDRRSEIAVCRERLDATCRRHLLMLRSRLASAHRQLQAVDPQAILQRGYSITTRKDGTLIRSTRHAPPGGSITTRVVDGTFDSIVSIRGGNSRGARASRGGPIADQFDLFASGE